MVNVIVAVMSFTTFVIELHQQLYLAAIARMQLLSLALPGS